METCALPFRQQYNSCASLFDDRNRRCLYEGGIGCRQRSLALPNVSRPRRCEKVICKQLQDLINSYSAVLIPDYG